jgi:hypothetical protein
MEKLIFNQKHKRYLKSVRRESAMCLNLVF